MTDTRNDGDWTDMLAGFQVSKSWEYRKRLLACSMVALFGFMGWYFHREFSRPAEGTVQVLTSEADPSDPVSPPVSVRHQKEYFTIVLPDTYQDKRRETNLVKGATLCEQAYFSDPTGSLRKVAVTIDERAHITPQDLTSYGYRKSHPEIYREQILQWRGQDILVFEKNESIYEVLAYIPKENRFIASVALISASETPEELIKDFSDILISFEWTH